LKGPRKYLSGRREFAGTNVTSDTLQYLLDKIKNKVELSFSEKLIELIKEKGKKPADIYKKAEIDKALFSKIKSDKNYHPTKGTALASAIALHLSLEETQDLIGRAGYALSSSIKRDLIVRCYIESKTYNVNDLNGKLIDYGFDPLTNKCGL
ncbi:MAG: XRE family transcriptional regulator, partial [Anaerovibrio sp.]|nr:XRE family transcriptional regulator [Anaerovibrio sp.]